MSEYFSSFDLNDNYAQKFIDKYAKKVKLPTTKLINAFFHPTLRDHIITLNQILFPETESCSVVGLIHDKIRGEFESKIQNHYMNAAEKFEAKRRVKQLKNVKIQNKKRTERFKSSSSDETLSLYWAENFSETSYEGGRKEKVGNKRNIKRNQVDCRCSKAIKQKSHFIDCFKIKGTYSKISSEISKSKNSKQNLDKQRCLDKAIDMYFQDKDVYLSYKGYDYALQVEPNSETPNLLINAELNIKIDDYWLERPSSYNTPLFLEYSPIPKINNMSYVPPPFREKYEICIWKIDSRGCTKIKSSYFSPDSMINCQRDSSLFEATMALDNQTMMLVEKFNDKEGLDEQSKNQRSIIMIDIYTLYKVVELNVDLVNSNFKKHEKYNELKDLNNSQFSQLCPTIVSIPRVTCWNDGKYILACVGAQPKSNIIFEFRVYSSETSKLICSFDRTKEYHMKHLMMEIVFNPHNRDSLLFIMKEDNQYSIIEIDFLKSISTEKCRYVVDNLNIIKIAEDLSQVFIVKQNFSSQCSELYCVEYAKDYFLEESKIEPIAELGSFVKYSQIIGNIILIVYESIDRTIKVGMFNSETNIEFEDQFKIDEIHGYTYLEETNEIVCLHKLRLTGVEATIINSKAYEISDKTFELVEISGYKFSFPYITMIKGGCEVIKYDFNLNQYLYCKLPSSIPIIQYESNEEIIYNGLMDLGPYYAKVLLNCDLKNDKFSLEANLNYIAKCHLPHDKLLNIISETKVNFMNTKILDAYLLHFVGSIFAYSKGKDIQVESK